MGKIGSTLSLTAVLLSGCLTSSSDLRPFIYTNTDGTTIEYKYVPPTQLKSDIFGQTRDTDEKVKKISSGKGYSTLIITADEAFGMRINYLPVMQYYPQTGRFRTTGHEILQNVEDRIERWQNATTPNLVPYTESKTIDENITKFNWSKPQNIKYISQPEISSSLEIAKKYTGEFDRIVIFQHGISGSLETKLNENKTEFTGEIKAADLQMQYPHNSMSHLMKYNG